MLDKLTVDDFKTLLGATFRAAVADGEVVMLRLDSAENLPAAGGPRKPFALLFTGTAQIPLNQQIYTLENDSLGQLDIFLVPVGETDGTREYEAVFN